MVTEYQSSEKKTLVFVSTRFLFPVDSGGKIRTTQVLRGLKKSGYSVTLLCPATPEELVKYTEDLAGICDRIDTWEQEARGMLFHYARLRHIFSKLPIPIRTDVNEAGLRLVEHHLEQKPAVVVYDFLHANVLRPATMRQIPSVMFTHNVESEIFKRQLENASSLPAKILWQNQYNKMCAFEKEALAEYDIVVAVSDRDATTFQSEFNARKTHTIPTGVDLDFFGYHPPTKSNHVIFCGSMDWLPNQEAISYFLKDIWPLVLAQCPNAQFTVIGRSPPESLLKLGEESQNVTFTGFVDDIRDYARHAGCAVIPIRIGGGTRLKAYEAMAMGTPMVSTAIGIEGLPLQAGEDYLHADTTEEFASQVLSLMGDQSLRTRIAEVARTKVEAQFSFQVAADSFACACENAEHVKDAK